MILEDHLKILKELRIPFKAAIIRILYITIEEHKNELESKGGLTYLLSQTLPPKPLIQPIKK